jgi:DNA-binding NtrC family response regulator
MIATVLLVDDEVPFVDAMSRRLKKRNIEVLAAYSGIEALARLEENRAVDLVILDMKMPGMDGIETLREIKKSYPLIEVVLLTGHATVETAIEGMKLGAYDYLMKPCEMDELVRKVVDAKARKARHQERIIEARGRAGRNPGGE